MAATATPEKPKVPTIEELVAIIEKQGRLIAELSAKSASLASAEPEREAPKFDLPAGPPWSIRVRAVRRGFYPNPERKPDGSIGRGTRHLVRNGRSEEHGGDEFVIEKPGDFAGGPMGWMELATAPGGPAPALPPTPVARAVQDPLMAGILPPSGAPQRTIES